MVIRYVIIKNGDVVDVLPDTSPGNNILPETGCVKKVENFNNGSTKISAKLDVDGFLYQKISMKNVTKVDIINRMYSDPPKKKNVVEIS